MVTRSVSYEVAPVETVIEGSEMDSDVRNGLALLIAGVIDIEKIEYVSGGGFGGYSDLPEAMTRRIENLCGGECPNGQPCMMEIVFDGTSGRAEGSRIELRCPGSSFGSKADAEEFEATREECRRRQSFTNNSLNNWLRHLPNEYAAATREINETKSRLADLEEDREKLLTIEV